MSFRASRPLLKQSASSLRWLERQYNDPFVKQRLNHPANYRSRSAFKLLELHAAYGHFLSQPDVRAVVDLGAAPGGWSQVVAGMFGAADPQLPARDYDAQDRTWGLKDRAPNPGADVLGADDLGADDVPWDVRGETAEAEAKAARRAQGGRKARTLAYQEKRKARRALAAQDEDAEDADTDAPSGAWSTSPAAAADPYLVPPHEHSNARPPLPVDAHPRAPAARSAAPRAAPDRRIVALDLLRMPPLAGVQTLQGDFLAPRSAELLGGLLATPGNPDGLADVVLSDMAANATGNRITDVEASLDIASAVWRFTKSHLRTRHEIGRTYGGVLVCVLPAFLS